MAGIAEDIAYERQLVGAKQLRYNTKIAQYYHQWYNNKLLELLAPEEASFRVLDCGCGTGVLLPALWQRYRRAVGIDFCLENLREARESNGAVPLVVGDIGNLPVAPQSFDHIVCRGVMYRLADAGRGFEQLFGALKEGGDLVIAEPIESSRALAALRDAASTAGIHPFPGRRIDYRSTQEWIEAAQAAGFRTVRWFHLGYLAFPLLGFPEAIAPMRYVPWPMVLAKALLAMDRVLARMPYVNRWSWQAVFHFRKLAALAPGPLIASDAVNKTR
jgi:SAM-dependent methyltransferase